MTLQTFGNSGRYLSKVYHEKRKEARESLGLFEWGEPDKTRYDLDNIQFDRKARHPLTDPRIEAEASAKSDVPLADGPVRD